MARLTNSDLEYLETVLLNGEVDNHTLLITEQLPNLISVYRHHNALCEDCGFPRCEHKQSPSCRGFNEI